MTRWKAFGYPYPKTDEEWSREFEWYKETPEYTYVNCNMTLSEFKRIFNVEFYHRFLGNVLAGFFLVPLAAFKLTKQISPRTTNKMVALLGVGFTQGMVGWWMVRSGLKEIPDHQTNPKVSTYRLLTHMSFAVAIYFVLFTQGIRIVQKKNIVLSSSDY